MQVFKYGALRPQPQDQKLLQDLLFKAGLYYNTLIGIYRHERDRLRSANPPVRKGSGLDACGVGPTGEERNRWRELIREQALERISKARNESGLSCGTYWLVEEAASKAARDSFPDLPRFRRNLESPWELVGACIPSNNGKKPISGVWSSDVEIRIVGKTPGERRTKAIVKLRVVAKRKESQWIEIPIILHRPLPQGSKVQRAAIQVVRQGLRYIYSVIITCNTTREFAPSGAGEVSINLGWRRIPGGVRIATALSKDGRVRHLVLPDSLLNKAKHAESLRALGDSWAVQRFGKDGARRRSRERSSIKLTPEGRELNSRHFDDASQVTAEHWARRDRHIYQWERDEYSQMLRSRHEVYRKWAREIAQEFGHLIIEDWSLALLALRTMQVEIPEARHYRFLVAPSYLRNELKLVFGKAHSLVTGKLTITCSQCMEISANAQKFKARSLVINCERCGASWDQDLNNAENQQKFFDPVAAE